MRTASRVLDDARRGAPRLVEPELGAFEPECRGDVAELLGRRQLVRRLRRSRDRPDPARLGAGQPRQDGRVRAERNRVAGRRCGDSGLTYSSISRPRSIAIRWTMRAYSTPIVIVTWAEALELPAQRAQLVRVALRVLVVDGDPAVRAGETTVSRGSAPAARAARRASRRILVVRLEVHGAERSASSS